MKKRREDEPDAVRSRMFVLQFLIEPSFDDSVSWDVFDVGLQDGREQTRLYRAVLSSGFETGDAVNPDESPLRQSFRDPQAKSEWMLLDSKEFETILTEFRSVRIPLLPAGFNVGCDGTTYQLTFGDLFVNARISWWEELPREWRALAPAVAKLKELIESTWPRGAPSRDD